MASPTLSVDPPSAGSPEASPKQAGGRHVPRRPVAAVGQLRPRGLFVLVFVVLFGATAIWSAATPLFGAPDERAQIVRAAAINHGIWTGCFLYAKQLGHCLPDPGQPNASENLPSFFALAGGPDADIHCFIHKATVPASCMHTLNHSPTKFDLVRGYTTSSHTYVARYPPLYYLIVGLPSRFGGSSIDLYLMRLISGALSSLFLAMAVVAARCWSRNRWLLLGLLIAMTPMTLFIAGVVNPSGLEISSAVAFWVAGTVLVTECSNAPPRGLMAVLAIAGTTFTLVRGISPFWLGCAVVVLALAAPKAARRALLRNRRVQVAAGLIAAATVGALAWIIPEHSLLQYTGKSPRPGVPRTVGEWTILWTAFRHTKYYLADMVGVFGSFDTYSPLLTYVIWGALLAGLLGAAVRFGGRRAVLLLGVLVAAVVVIPVAIVSSHAHQYGYNWSGRDTLPLAVGLPIIAAGLLGGVARRDRGLSATRVALVVVPLTSVAQFFAFAEALRRNSVGTRGALVAFVIHPEWQPAITVAGSLVLELIAIGAVAGLWLAMLRAPERHPYEEQRPAALAQ